jgi:hypothetical protein
MITGSLLHLPIAHLFSFGQIALKVPWQAVIILNIFSRESKLNTFSKYALAKHVAPLPLAGHAKWSMGSLLHQPTLHPSSISQFALVVPQPEIPMLNTFEHFEL